MTTRGKGQGRPAMTRPSPLAALVKKKKTPAKRATKIVPTKALTAAVNKIVNKKAETKLAISPPINFNTNTTLFDFEAFSTAITSTNELYMLIPEVPQGQGDYQRIGNVIQPTSLTTKVNISAVNRTPSSINIYAHIFFLTSKQVKDWKLTNSVLTAQMLDAGDGTNVPFDGTSYTAMLPINKSQYNVIAHKKILLSKGANNPNNIYNNDEEPSADTFRYTATFSQKIPLPKKLLYADASQQYPTNAFPFMCCGFTAADNQGQTALSSLILRVQAQSHLYYKDE